MADHQHDHSHAHDDHHHEGESYFIDQLCMVGLSGAFGVICLCLFFWQSKMLTLMLGEQFHLYVVVSGFVLTALALARGVILWNQSRDPAFLHQHDHDQDHGHHHGHEHAIQEKSPHLHSIAPLPMHEHGASCGHEHKPGEACDHGHEHHAQVAGHHHDHDHDEADHDHGWAPWRYVVILVPIILFLLGLPDRPPSIMASGDRSLISMSPETETYVQSIAIGPDPFTQLVHIGVAYNQPASGVGEKVTFRVLDQMAASEDSRKDWKDKVVEVRGQYSPLAGTDQVFMLVRLKIQCCANDAVQLNVPMISRESIKGIALSDWVKVTGRVDFRERGGSYMTVLRIAKASDVVKCDPDPNPYIQ